MEQAALDVAVAILLSGSRVWIQQRRRTEHLDGYWEFPGGKLEAGETALEALLREVREEVGIDLKGGAVQLFHEQEFAYPQRRVRLHFFLCALGSASLQAQGRWVAVGELSRYRMPEANREVIEALSSLAGREGLDVL